MRKKSEKERKKGKEIATKKELKEKGKSVDTLRQISPRCSN